MIYLNIKFTACYNCDWDQVVKVAFINLLNVLTTVIISIVTLARLIVKTSFCQRL